MDEPTLEQACRQLRRETEDLEDAMGYASDLAIEYGLSVEEVKEMIRRVSY